MQNFNALKVAIERDGPSRNAEQALEVLNRAFVQLIEEWHLLSPNEQGEQSVQFLEAQVNFHFLGNLYIELIYNGYEHIDDATPVAQADTVEVVLSEEDGSVEPMDEQEQPSVPEQMPELVPAEQWQQQEVALAEQQQQELALAQKQQELALAQQQQQEQELLKQQQQHQESVVEDASTSAVVEQPMQVDKKEEPKKKLSENLPDISTLSFTDHIRVLHPVFSLRPIDQLSENKIMEIILSIQEVNHRARELHVSITSQHRALLTFMHGLLDITSQQLWMWQLLDREPNWDNFVHFLVRRAHTIDPAELPRRSSAVQPPSSGNPQFQRAVMAPPSRDPSPAAGPSRSPSGEKCPKCNNQHQLIRCPEFLALSIDERNWFVGEQNLCDNCFSRHHKTKKCIRGKCPKCRFKHNSLLGCPSGATGGN